MMSLGPIRIAPWSNTLADVFVFFLMMHDEESKVQVFPSSVSLNIPVTPTCQFKAS